MKTIIKYGVLPPLAIGLVAMSLTASPATAKREPALRYTITELEVPAGYTGSTATDINASGQVVGSVSKDALNIQACLWSRGKIKMLGTLGGCSSAASGVNAFGEVVGYSYTKEGDRYAFLYSAGRMSSLGALGTARDSEASAVNSKGQIAGYSQFEEGSQGFLYENSMMVGLGSLGGVRGKAFDINASGHVVGETTVKRFDSGSRAFLWKDGKMSDISLAGSDLSVANAVNDRGQAVGFGLTDQREYQAFLYSDGKVRDLGMLPGSRDTRPTDINNLGWIVGTAYKQQGNLAITLTTRACLYWNGRWYDLNDLIPASSGWRLDAASAINDKGQIVGAGTHNSKHRAFLMTPQ